jgi:hypothetical protein
MKKLAILLVATALMCVPVITMAAPVHAATEVTVNLEDLDQVARNKVLDSLKKAEKKAAETASTSVLEKVKDVNPEDVERWGKVIAKGIETVCSTLSVEVNDFIKTPVGMVTTGLIAYQIVGKDIRAYFNDAKAIFFGGLLWIVGLPIVLWSYVKFHVPKKVKTRQENYEGKGKAPVTGVLYVKRYQFRTGDAKCTSACFHALFFAVILITGLLMMA